MSISRLMEVDMRTIKAFINGMREFKLSCTTHYDGRLLQAYDWGRELAHRVTLRRYDHI